MANKHEDHLVQCPYYKTNTSQVVYCEGLEDGMVLHLAFATHAQLIDGLSERGDNNAEWLMEGEG